MLLGFWEDLFEQPGTDYLKCLPLGRTIDYVCSWEDLLKLLVLCILLVLSHWEIQCWLLEWYKAVNQYGVGIVCEALSP